MAKQVHVLNIIANVNPRTTKTLTCADNIMEEVVRDVGKFRGNPLDLLVIGGEYFVNFTTPSTGRFDFCLEAALRNEGYPNPKVKYKSVIDFGDKTSATRELARQGGGEEVIYINEAPFQSGVVYGVIFDDGIIPHA